MFMSFILQRALRARASFRTHQSLVSVFVWGGGGVLQTYRHQRGERRMPIEG